MLDRLRSYFQYWLKAKGPDKVHSPFVFRLYTERILSDKHYYAFAGIEKQRERLLNTAESITDVDPGAGSRKGTSNRTIQHIAKNSLLSPAQGRILFRLAEHFQPQIMLELGTSLGISALYLAKACRGELHTIEGQPSVARIAHSVIKKGGVKNVQLHEGLFDEVLPQLLPKLGKVDLLYLDGNHTFEATLAYFHQILPYLHDASVIIMDDIRWSKGMMNAWEHLCQRDDIHVSIDLQKFGLLFFRPSQVKEHFILRV
jgi:predicted O-methyltransferase YrrM